MKVEALEATTADGVALRGELIRGSDTWLVLVHDVGADIDSWKPLRPGLARRGWTILGLDLRGHGGSDGEWTGERGELDVDLGITLARRLGARHVCVIAAGFGGVLALRAVERAHAQELFELPDSLVLISPVLDGIDPQTCRGRGLPRLFLYGARDEAARADATALQRAAIGWNVTASFGTGSQGARLIAELAANVQDKIAGFLKEQSLLKGPGQLRAERRRLPG
jgi:pimeloyl-ACP methyl ester carboxylesterase